MDNSKFNTEYLKDTSDIKERANYVMLNILDALVTGDYELLVTLGGRGNNDHDFALTDFLANVAKIRELLLEAERPLVYKENIPYEYRKEIYRECGFTMEKVAKIISNIALFDLPKLQYIEPYKSAIINATVNTVTYSTLYRIMDRLDIKSEFNTVENTGPIEQYIKSTSEMEAIAKKYTESYTKDAIFNIFNKFGKDVYSVINMLHVKMI